MTFRVCGISFNGSRNDSSSSTTMSAAGPSGFVSFRSISSAIGPISTRWRIVVLADHGSAAFSLAEIWWFHERTRLSLVEELSSISTSDGSVFGNAVDGDTSSTASFKATTSDETNNWIEFQFKRAVDASKVVVQTAASAENCVGVAAVVAYDAVSQQWIPVSFLWNLQYPQSRVVAYGTSTSCLSWL